MRARIFVEAWDPEYGASLSPFEPWDEDRLPSQADVDPEIELPAGEWRPIRPVRGPEAAPRILFVDGVRRIDAMVWIQDATDRIRAGLCGSYAAGTVAAESRAEIGEIRVRRGLFTGMPDAGDLVTELGTYLAQTARGETLKAFSSEVQEQLRKLEVEVASAGAGFDLLVVDGPLSTHHAAGLVIGYVKAHRVSYLDSGLERVVRALAPGERTPMFRTRTSWSRYSCYLRLPVPEATRSHPWAGIVRLEVSGETPLDQARSLMNLACGALPSFSSVPHKDPRAPQNLFPIGGLERELRRRLGDHALVHRALRSAAARTL
jgi:hypothetical protein